MRRKKLAPLTHNNTSYPKTLLSNIAHVPKQLGLAVRSRRPFVLCPVLSIVATVIRPTHVCIAPVVCGKEPGDSLLQHAQQTLIPRTRLMVDQVFQGQHSNVSRTYPQKWGFNIAANLDLLLEFCYFSTSSWNTVSRFT